MYSRRFMITHRDRKWLQRERKKKKEFSVSVHENQISKKTTTSQSSYQQREHVQWTKVTDENIDKKSECL